MASKKPTRKKRPNARPQPKATRKSSKCVCGGDCRDPHAKLPGYFLIALGMMAVPLNLGLIPELAWVKAWPVLMVLFGFVLIVKSVVCRRH